jgi:hypothetical protein
LIVTIDTVLMRDGEHIPAALDDKVAVLSIDAGSCFSFNDVGGEIWNFLAEPRRVGDIGSRLSQLYDVDANVAIRDIIPFLQTLIARRLLRTVEPDVGR